MKEDKVVYVVEAGFTHEGFEIMGVFATNEAAVAEADRVEALNRYDFVDVEGFRVKENSDE